MDSHTFHQVPSSRLEVIVAVNKLEPNTYNLLTKETGRSD